MNQKRALDLRTAINSINRNGALLVFPIQNRSEPKSLWSEFHPRTKMRWEWDNDGDDRVGQLWRLMKELSKSRDVVYSKWYQSRATFFSREVFTGLLALARRKEIDQGLESNARLLLETLESDSPLSTKELKRATDMQGKINESIYQRAMQQLFSRFLIVAFGEVEDGAFPSLAVGATSLLFEDLWQQAGDLPMDEAWLVIDRKLRQDTLFRAHFSKNYRTWGSGANTS